MNISDRRFVYNKRTDILKRFRDECGWEPPEKKAEEIEATSRHEGAIRALKAVEAELLEQDARNAAVASAALCLHAVVNISSRKK